jgi:MFS family permease
MSKLSRFQFPKEYYLLNLIFMLERTAWFILIIQIPIFIAQKGEGGLGFSQTDKGIIYLYWVILQNSLPLLTGSLIDKSVKKKSLLILSCLLLFLAFLSIGLYQNLFGLLIGITLVSLGVSIFNPLMKGQIGNLINKQNSSFGWGFHFWIYNLSIFVIGVPYSKYLRELGWDYVFVGAGILYILALLLSLFLKSKKEELNIKTNVKVNLQETLTVFKRNYNYVLLVSMSGFAVLFMQFYETLPNFIYDWSDTSSIVTSLGLSKSFTMETWAGSGISFEWLYNINTGLTLLLLLPLSVLLRKYQIVNTLFVGVSLVVIGFGLSIIYQNGLFLILGFTVYTLGELITNPKFTEYFDYISLRNEQSTHMGLLFISNLIGYPIGALLGGYMYGGFGEKASLAQKYLHSRLGQDIEIEFAIVVLKENMGYDDMQVTKLLWDHYNPMVAFIPFLIIGVLSLVGILIYKKLINQNKYIHR